MDSIVDREHNGGTGVPWIVERLPTRAVRAGMHLDSAGFAARTWQGPPVMHQNINKYTIRT